MDIHKVNEPEFYGTTTVGGKGQIVVPAEARTSMKVKQGDKLLVFGLGTDMVILSKLSNLEKFASHLSKQLVAIRDIIKKTSS